MSPAEKRMMQEAYEALATAVEKLAAFPHDGKITPAVREADRAYTPANRALRIIETFINRHA